MKKEISKKEEEEANAAIISHFSNENIEKGKALSMLIPLIRTEDWIEMLAELYDLKNKTK